MITRLQARSMTNEQVFDIVKKACDRNNTKVIRAKFNNVTLELIILVEKIINIGDIECDIDAVLIGVYDLEFNQVEDSTLKLEYEPCCPNTLVTSDFENYKGLTEGTGGEEFVW